MENKIAVLDRNIPLRAYPEQDLNKALLMEFLPWLTRILSLTDEVSADRLEVALPAIKDSCIGMGFVEIKKMFTMYVDGYLSIKPIPNYFDRILFGKIVDAYKSQKPKQKKEPKIKELSLKEKQEIMKSACERIFAQYKELGEITDKSDHVYDHLFSLGKLPKSELYRKSMFAKATLRAKSEAATNAGKNIIAHRKLKSVLEEITNGSKKSEIISIAKKLILEEYFKDLNELKI